MGSLMWTWVGGSVAWAGEADGKVRTDGTCAADDRLSPDARSSPDGLSSGLDCAIDGAGTGRSALLGCSDWLWWIAEVMAPGVNDWAPVLSLFDCSVIR